MTTSRRPALTRASILATAACLLLVALLTWQVLAGGPAVSLDHRINGLGVDSAEWLEWVTDAGSPELSGVVLAVVAVSTAFTTGRWWPVALAAGSGGAMTLVVWVLKTAVGRPGPGLYETPDGYPGYFPSGHTASAAVCLGTALYIEMRRRRSRAAGPLRLFGAPRSPAAVRTLATYGGLALGFVVGVFTVASGYHWTSDVVASLALSYVILTWSFALVERLVDGRRLDGG